MKRFFVRTLDEEPSEDDIYGRAARLHFLDDEEITPQEAAFMEGYEEAL